MKIGIGLLIDDDAHNDLRDLEIIVSNATGNELGLFQPPHITIKRPFEADQNTFEDTKKILKDFSEAVEEFRIDLGIYKTFSNEVLYAYPDETKIVDAQKILLEMLDKISIKPDEFDVEKYIAHSTIALGLSPNEFEIAESKLHNYESKTITTVISKIGLFLNVDEKHWIVVAVEKLRTAQ